MNAIEENNLKGEIYEAHILETKSGKKKEKNDETKSFKNLKNSILLKTSSNSKNKLNNKLSQITTNANIKRVKFKKEVTVINIDCWKKYNLDYPNDDGGLENTTEENNDDKGDKNQKKKKKKNKDKNINNNKENISCTCLIV